MYSEGNVTAQRLTLFFCTFFFIADRVRILRRRRGAVASANELVFPADGAFDVTLAEVGATRAASAAFLVFTAQIGTDRMGDFFEELQGPGEVRGGAELDVAGGDSFGAAGEDGSGGLVERAVAMMNQARVAGVMRRVETCVVLSSPL